MCGAELQEWDVGHRKLGSIYSDTYSVSVFILGPEFLVNTLLQCLKLLIAYLLLFLLKQLMSKVGFCPSLLCANNFTGQDGTLQSFSTVHEKFNKSLGRGKYFSQNTNMNEKKS